MKYYKEILQLKIVLWKYDIIQQHIILYPQIQPLIFVKSIYKALVTAL